jgi:RNA polymerase sigma factor (sigma-70 family)
VNSSVEARTTVTRPRGPDATGLGGYLDRVRRVRRLDAVEERGLATRVRRMRDGAAARRLVTSHLRTVIRIAWQYRRLHPSYLELIQEGNLALVRAVWCYDPERSGPLSSYAGAWIRTCIARFVLARHRRAERGRPPVERPAPTAVDDRPFLAFEETAFLDRLAAVLPRFTADLPRREVGILRDRMLRDPPRTLAAQGRELGITAERVRQIERSLLARLRDVLLAGDGHC